MKLVLGAAHVNVRGTHAVAVSIYISQRLRGSSQVNRRPSNEA